MNQNRPDDRSLVNRSVLDALKQTVGSVDRILLGDPASPDEPSYVVRPLSSEMPPLHDESGRLQLIGEIASGGMGAVFLGRDRDLGRDLAVKVLLEAHCESPDLVLRFVEEAQIAGQLQHPGIVPVYELGHFADARPYFSMKLVKGRTFAEVLRERPHPGHEMSKHVASWLRVCQTMAYAHARGVVHRDLKPSNIMLGKFGEVQVMDWGLAKVLHHEEVAANATQSAVKPAADQSTVATIRSSGGSQSGVSHVGLVLGTPAYMAPEQARGEIERMDERCDVFALGSILCEILTGQPAFAGKDTREIHQKSSQGDLADAHARLDASIGDAELIALAKDCLAPDRIDRPRDAGAVAARGLGYAGSLEERMRRAQLDRAAESARAEEAGRRLNVERHKRRYQVAMVAAVLALTFASGLTFHYWAQERRARSARLALALEEATLLVKQAAASSEDVGLWDAAKTGALRAAATLCDAGGSAESARLSALRTEIDVNLAASRRDRALLAALVQTRTARHELGLDGADRAYARAFSDAGLDVDAAPAGVVGMALKNRPRSVAVAAGTALDDWALVLRRDGQPLARWSRPLEVALVADPDPFRDRIRSTLLEPSAETKDSALRAIASDPKAVELPPPTAVLLAAALRDLKAIEPAVALLRAVAVRHPDDVWASYELAEALSELGPGAREEAMRHFTSARALRPETAHEFAHLLETMGRSDEAQAIFIDLVARQPDDSRALSCYGCFLMNRRRPGAEAMFERAVAAAREEVRRKPDSASARKELGFSLGRQGRLAEAEAELRIAATLRPNDAEVHANLGTALFNQGKTAPAEAEFRAALRLKPGLAEVHFNLGNVLASQGKPELAEREFRTALRLNPDLVEAYSGAGLVFWQLGDYAGALAELRKAREISCKKAGQPYSSTASLDELGRLTALAARLPAVLKGEDHPRDAHERLAFAGLAFKRRQFTAAARFWVDALAENPEFGADRQAQHRYNAACAMALAATGQGMDEPPPDGHAKAQFRCEALGQLNAELDAWTRLLDSGTPLVRAMILRTLHHWQVDADLAAVRDAAALDRLPTNERAACRALWSQVDALISRARCGSKR